VITAQNTTDQQQSTSPDAKRFLTPLAPPAITSKAQSADRKKPIRILHVMDKLSKDGSKIHGPARQMLYRLPCYDPQCYDTLVINMRNEDEASKLLRDSGIKVTSLARTKFDPLILLDLFRIMKTWKPDVIHLHGYASWNCGRVLGKITSTPIVVQEHFIDKHTPFYQKIVDLCLRSVHDQAIAVSQAVKNFMAKQRYVRGNITVIWNSAPFDQLSKTSEQDIRDLRQKYSLAPDTTIVGMIARLDQGKGHECFLRAAKQVLEQFANAVFFVVGEGPLGNDLKQLDQSLGLQDKVIFTGYQANVFSYLSLFDLSIIASDNEGFPGIGIESFASQTPLVCTDIPGVRGLYEHDKNALVVPPGNPDSLAKAILRVLTNPQLAQKLTRNGTLVAQQCSTSIIAKQYTDCYDEILARK
jgi:glycosyltransferase involved in cell wall biosynthesis